MLVACIYHATLPMQVVSYEDRDRLVATGEWFRHPNDAKGESYGQIRRNEGKRKRNRKCKTQPIGSGT